MPTTTYTAIGAVTLGTATAEVTFTVPSGYRDLILAVNAINTTNDITWSMRINGDTAANYSYVLARGKSISPTTESNSASSQTSMFIAGWSFGQGSTNPTAVLIQFQDASATDKHKTLLTRYSTTRNDGNGEVGMIAGRWASTNAITRISIFPNSSTFASTSTFNLWGIAA